MAAQAADAVNAARAATQRHTIVFLNPVNEKALRFTSIEPTDYPCSNMKEFETIVGLTKDLITGMLGQEAEAGIKVKRIDEGGLDGDLCAVVTSAGAEVAAVVWPTAEKLPVIKAMAAEAAAAAGGRGGGGGRQLLIVNPLWKTEGNLVSEFGLLPWQRKDNEELVASFPVAYALYEQRIGAPSSVNMARGTRYESGAVLRVLRVAPGPYTVHVVAGDGASQPIGSFDSKPTYKELEALVDSARKAKLGIFAVARAASSLDLEAARARGAPADGTALGGDGGGADPTGSGASFPSSAELPEMDIKAVRRLIMSLGLPTSGTPAKILARAVAVAEALEAGASPKDALAAAKKLR